MNNLNLIQTKDAYYENKIHYDKKYLMKAQNSAKIMLKEHEFLFIRNNAKTIIQELSKIINGNKNNPNLCFEKTYGFFESFMPNFLDAFFSIVFDATILRTSNELFDKAYFLQNIKKETNCFPHAYNEEVLQKCVYEDFPKYVLLKNSTIKQYLFIRVGWILLILTFFKAFIKYSNNSNFDKLWAIRRKQLLKRIDKAVNPLFPPLMYWTDYEFFEKVFYEYARSLFKWPNEWDKCTI